eukprot:scpid76097/ scgid15844/ Tripartite motif-containing protein 2; E3 ubiquitin-protein ligase TRIM2
MFRSGTACVQCEAERPDNGRLLRCLHVLCDRCLRESVRPDTASVRCTWCDEETVLLSNGGAASRVDIWNSLPPSTGLLYPQSLQEQQTHASQDWIKCSIHTDQVLSVFCKTCDVPLCGICITSHIQADHSFTPCKEEAKKRRQAIGEAVRDLNNVPGLSDKSRLDKRLEEFGTAIGQVDTQAKKASNSVTDFFDEIVAALEKEKHRLLVEIDKHRFADRGRLEAQQIQLHGKLQALGTVRALGESLAGASPSPKDNTVSSSDTHALALHNIILQATRGMKPVDLDTPVSHITGELGVTIAPDAVKDTVKNVRSHTTVYSTKVDVDAAAANFQAMARRVAGDAKQYYVWRVPLLGFDGVPLQSATVPQDFHVHLVHVDDTVEDLQWTVCSTGAGIWESQLLALDNGGYPMCVSSSQKKLYRCFSVRSKLKFSADQCSCSLALSDDGYTITATDSGFASAITESGYASGRECWVFTIKWSSHDPIFVGVTKQPESGPSDATTAQLQMFEHSHGWWVGSDDEPPQQQQQ